MKLFKIMIALIMPWLLACQSNETELFSYAQKGTPIGAMESNCYSITKEVSTVEVNNVVKSLFDKEAASRSINYDITLYKDSMGVGRVIAVNFEGSNGFVLLSGVKTYNPILAYSKDGSFNIGEEDSPMKTWLAATIHDIELSGSQSPDSLRRILKKWRYFEDKSAIAQSRSYGDEEDHTTLKTMTDAEYQQFSRQIMDRMREWNQDGFTYYTIDKYNGTCDLGGHTNIVNFVRGCIYPMYEDDYWALTFVIEREHNKKTGKGNWLQSHWEQQNGYNQSFEYLNNKVLCKVGCGNIAVGQIMYGYRHPDCFNWEAMTLSGPGNKVTSDFLLDVKNKCNSILDYEEGTYGTTQIGRSNALKSYGYEFENVDAAGVTQENLWYKSPAIISSYLEHGSDYDGYHAWIVEGGQYLDIGTDIEIWTVGYSGAFEKVYSEYVSPELLFYVNWGWGLKDKCDAYYSFGSMIPWNSGYTSSVIRNATIDIKPSTQQ